MFGTGLFVPSVAAAPLCASPPLTGNTTATGVINTYYPGQTSITAGTSNTTVTVGTSRGSATPIAVGDLVMVMQMQGAEINATNTNAYGDGVTSATASGFLNNASFIAGQYEYATVRSVAGAVVGLDGSGTNGGLINNYVNASESATQGQQRFQVVRVPQYSSATLSVATPPAAVAWDGSSGGIVVLDVASDLNLNGATINVTGQGFRGGLQRSRSGTGGLANTDYRTTTAQAANGQKAEGIAGTTKWTTGSADTVGDGYPNGDFGRGAPGNAGGGGTDGDPASNSENSGGGGGGNGGAGGVGGNTWSSNLARGGHGGAVVPGTASRVFLGGGGGAGSDNNAVLSSSGGAGGGMVLVRAGSLSGTGTINADGAAGNVSGQDGSGGGGAGGSIVVLTSLTGAASGISGLTARARGGAGGNETHADQHGPGGGGGGGRVITAAATASTVVTAGANGTHVPTSSAYGATSGSAGASSATAVVGDAPGTNTGSQCIDASVTKSTNPTPVIPGQTVTYTVVATNDGPYPRTGTAPIVVTDTLPAGLTSATWTCSASAGSNCTASGSGSLSTTANLEVGDSATYTITATLASTFTGTLSNTATVAGPATIPELNATNNSATSAVLAEPRANLGITKTDGVAAEVPGTNAVYTIVASNAGPSTATNALITDSLPAGTISGSWTCAAGSGGTCGAASGTMPMSTTATLSPSGTVTYTVTVAVSSTATGSLANTVTIAAPAGTVETNSANNVATDTDNLTPTADLSISKTDGLTTIDAGTGLTYTIALSNAGPSAITGATVTDTFPASLTGATWTCAASAGSSCPASGSGSISASVNVLAAGSVTFTVTATVVSTATGTLSNTATVALPGGATDPTAANNTATDTTTITRRADVSITKTDGAATEVPGTSVTYTIVAANAGPSAAIGTSVTDTLPASLTGATWTCTATAGSTCPASGSGNISTTVDLLPSGSATFTLTATIASTATGSLANTATVAVAAGVTDPAAGNNSATDTDTLTPTADLSITKTDGVTGEVPGTAVTYTIVASNAGPSTATAATATDTLPAVLSGGTWTCSASVGSTCPASGSGNINASVTLAPGGTATFTLTATISSSATGSLANTATIAAPASVTDPTPGNNSATDVDTLTPTGDLSITKTDGVATAIPGQSVTYTIVATNAGPSVITAATVADTFPASIAGATWTCSASAGSSCPASGSGNINANVNLAVAGTATFTVTAPISPTATGSLVNTATIAAPAGSSDPSGANNSATDTDTLTPTADLSITKTDGAATEVPGTPVTYTIVASNAGPSAASGSNVADTFPAALTGATWTCSAGGGATCPASGSGNISATVDLPVGGTASFTVNGTVAAGATGSLTNTATVSVGAGITDPAPGNNAATDTDTLTPTADLLITKTDGATTEVPGTSVTYTIVASNAGPSTITAATVTDTMPASLSGVTWTCSASAGSSCPASGSGSISASVTLVSGGAATFTVTGAISATATGSLANTATVALPGGATDPTPANNSATDTDTLTPTADLSITKTDGSATEVPGTAVTYTIVASNAGPSAVTAATVADTMPAALTGVTWTCSASSGAACPASGSGDINASVDLPVGGSATFTVSATISASATGNLVNTATVAAPGGVTDPTPANNSATDADSLIPTADLSITKTDGVVTEVPGTAVAYTIVATNGGPSAVSAATIADTMPAALTGVTWTCAGASGGTCPASGSGNINVSVDLPVGASVTFTVSATISTSATGTLVNTATIAPPAGVTDPTPANNSATDTDTLNPTADLSITKTDGSATEVPGTAVTYTIVAGNSGPSAVIAATVADTIPATLNGATWTCVPAGGGSCAASSGSGNISTTVDLPVGATATFTISATVVATTTGNLVNTASITAPGGVTDPTPANNSATDTDTLNPTADLSISKTDGVASVIPGQSTTYTVVVGNAGPSTAVNAPVADALPAGATSGSWTCAASVGASCGAASGSMPIATTVTIAAGATATYNVVVAVSSTATGSLTNTSTVQAPAGVTDPVSADNSATDIDSLTPTADVSISKTDGLTTVVPGANVTYTVVASNPGPSTVTGATVSDTIPAALSGATWTCSASGGSTCPATGSGDLAASVTLAPGGSTTFTISATVVASATGTISNTATITLPGTVTDPTPANNSATDLTTVTPQTDLTITKTDGTPTAVPGQSTTYTIVVTNTGPSSVTGAAVTDTMPAGVTTMNWSCAGSGGGSCPAAGSGSISDNVDLPVGASVTYTVTVAVAAGATGTLTNTATVAAPLGVTDTNAANNTATDVDTLTPRADLAVTKTDGVASVIPGQSTTYTVTVTNAGPSDAPNTVVTDATPVDASFTSWSCSPSAGAACSTASGSGSINTSVDLPLGTIVTFVVDAAIDAAATGTLGNTATAAPAPGITDPVVGNNSATDTDTLTPTADLAITKTNLLSTVVPGDPISYTVTASNSGPSSVVGASVVDALPASLTAATWTCAASGGGSCTSSGSGSINETVNLPVGATVIYTVDGVVASAAIGSIDNTATVGVPVGVTDPVVGNNSATDSDPLTPEVDLSITKTDGLAIADPLDAVTYTIVVSNDGPSSVSDAQVVDLIPAALLGATWTCASGVGGNCDLAGPVAGDINTTVDLAVNGSVQFTVTATIAGSTIGTVINTATVSAPSGVSETNSADNAATDATAVTSTAALSITKTDGQATDVAGTSSTYTITVANSGPSAVINAAVADALPPALTNATWTCTASGAGNCDDAGPTAGDINSTVDLPSGESATFTVTATVDPSFTGLLSNTATVTAPPGTIDDPSNNSSTDDTTVVAEANLTVAKSDGTVTATPGADTTYTVTVDNAGPSAVVGATVGDVLPAGATAMNWTCAASVGSSCTASGSGSLGDTVDLLPGGQVTYVVIVDIDAAATGLLTNTATATVPPTMTETSPLDNTATDIDSLVAETDLAITKTDNTLAAVPGTAITYTIVATNNGPSDAIGATVADTFPGELNSISWTCVGPCTPAGSGALNDVVGLPVGATVTYTVTATIAASAVGVLSNTATVTAAPGTVDPNPVNDSATDVDTLAAVADLSITKTDGAANEVPGTPVSYTIVVSNNGPSDVVGASVVDTFPLDLANATWSCVAAGGTCPVAGSGDINAVVILAVGGAATFAVTADVAASATGTLTNTATVTAPPATDPNAGNNSATDVDTLSPEVDLSVTKTDNDLVAQPGDSVTYEIVVSNAGPSAVIGAPFTDIVPSSLVGVSWTCAASSGASCPAAGSGNAINTTLSLTPGGTATFTVTATVDAPATGVIANTATIAAPVGVVETASGDNTATDTTSVTPTADLIITKTDGLTSIAAGQAITYTIVVTNAGPSTITDALVTDVLPSALVGATWTCAASAGSSCLDAAGSGDISDLVTLASTGTATFTVSATVAASTPAGTLSNTADVAMPVGSVDPTPANNTATDTTTIERHADLEVTKTDGVSSATPGLAIQYTIVVTNNGPSNVSAATVVDTMPATLIGATWTCSASVGSTCPASGSGDFASLVDLLAGGTATFTVDATVAASALGTLVNTAGATVPSGVTDPVPGNNSSTDTDTLDPVADLSITKDDFSATATPGAPVTYTVVVSNAGPSDVIGATVADVLPATLSGVTWSCSVSGSGSCPASGSGDVNSLVSLTVGATATFTITGTLSAAATANLVNTATVTAPVGVTDPAPADNSATDVDTLARVADLSVTKTDFAATATPGTAVSYQIVATNNGPSDITGAVVTDTPPAELTGVTWSCTATGGASCSNSSGVGAINELADLPVGASVTFTLTATLSPAATVPVANTVQIAVPAGATDPNPSNNTATDTDAIVPVADLSITKTVDLAAALPDDVLTYTIVVANAGPSDISDSLVDDVVPADVVGATWTCAAQAGGNCDLTGPVSGDIAGTVDLVVGGSVSFTVTGTVASTATGTIINSATVAAPAGANDPNPANNTSSASTTINPKADLSITKTDGNVTDVAGTSLQYSIVVTNSGPSTIQDAPVDDVLPAALLAVSWTCSPSAFSVCDDPAGGGDITTTVDLLAGGTATFVIDASIDPAFAGVLTNTASVTMPGVGVDPTPANNSATDLTTIVAEADLSITKTDGSLAATPGGSTVYTVTVSNSGPSTVVGAPVSDAIPAGATAMNWTCLASPGSSCAPSGSGALADTVSLLPGGAATYQATVDISSAATGAFVNTASVAAPIGVTDPAPANNSATDIDTLSPSADLSITKTDGLSNAVPGTSLTYTVVATNAGPSDAVGATINDSLPASLVGSTWTCVGTGGGTCAGAGVGNIADTVNLPTGASVTYSVTAMIDSNATGTLVNTASIAAPIGTTDPDPSDNSATDTDTLTPQSDLFVTKTDGQTNVVPGTPVTYTVVAGNAGPSAVAGATVTDLLSADLLGASWTCAAAGGRCPATGTGNIAANIDLAVGGTATFTISATVSPSATSTLANTVDVAVPSGVTDPMAGNNTATDTDTLNPEADLSISKTDGRISAQPGDAITYTLVAANAGPSAVVGAPVIDALPAGLSAASWTCAPSAGASCPASGSGNINTTVSLPVGATAIFTVTTSITATSGVVANTVQIDAPAGVSDPSTGDNVATDTTSITPTADLSITKTDGLTTVAAGEVVTYSIVATNAGPSPIIGATVADAIPGVLVGASWTCSATVGSTCANATGSGSINELADLAAGGQVTFSITGTVNGSAAPGLLSNTATITMPFGSIDPTPGNNSATDTTVIERRADLSISKDDFTGAAVAGGSTTYTVVVSNNGPSNVFGAAVSDPIPTGVTAMTWTCSATAGASCIVAGTGALATNVNLAAGSSVTFTVVVDIDAAASGLLTNIASVIPPSGVTDPNSANDSDTDVDTVAGVADLTITKDDGSSTATPGSTTTYTMVVTNNGPSNVTGATVTDLQPVGTTFDSWACTATGAASCSDPSGTGSISTTVDLAVGASVTFTVVMAIDSSVTADVTNTATVAAPSGVTDPNSGDNAASDTDTMLLVADLSITKTDGSATVTPGTTVVYSVTASNAGPSDIAGAAVTDLVPAALTGATWTCAGTSGGACTTATGSAPINQSVDLPVGGSVTFTITGVVDPALVGDLVNTATVAAPVGVIDPNPGNNSATDLDTNTPVTDLAVSKTDGLTSALPGDVVTYTVTVSSAGPSDAVGASLIDAVPAVLTGVTWTCAAVNGGCVASGTGSLNESIDVAVGGTVTFSITGTVVGTATGTITNTATVMAPAGANDPNPGDNSATDATTVNPKADLSITKTDGNLSDVAGTTVTYTIEVANAGPSMITGAPVADVMPPALSGATWSCTATAGSVCGGVGGAGDIAATVDLLAGGVATFTVTATIDAAFTGTLTNTATVAMPGPGVDPTPGNNIAVDTTDVVAVADLSVTKTDGVVSEVPGTAVSYTIVVSNAGPSDVVGASVSDVMPVSLSNVLWSCVGVAGGVCSPSGTGDVVDVIDVASGGSVTYSVSGDLAADASGVLVNAVSVVAPGSVTDPDLSNNSASDVDTLVPTADLSVTKTDGVVSEVPGTAVSYTIVVSNAGPSDVVGASVTDVFPATLIGASWTCVAVNGACPASGSGSISELVDLATGGTATFTVTATLSSSATGSITNTATVTPPAGATDPDPTNNSDADTDTLDAVADLSITKTDNDTNARPGDLITYEIVASNAGPSAITGAVVSDAMPAGVFGVSWTCAAGSGATCPASGIGDLNETVDLAVGASATFTVTATVTASVGSITNTAQIDAPAGATDPNTADNVASDTTQVDPLGDLSITKTDGLTSAAPGAGISYSIVVSNSGPSAAAGVAISDTVPPSLSGVTWSCTASPGSACTNATGTGDISELVDLAAGGSVSFMVAATIDADATGVLSNTATVAPPSGFADSDSANNSATDVTDLDPAVDLAATKTDGQVIAIPGTPISYIIVVTNAGPSVAAGSQVLDSLPASLLGATWTCSAAPGSSCGAPSGSGSIDEIVTVGVGGTLTYIVAASVSPSAVGVLANTVTVMPALGTGDTNAGNNSATDVDSLSPQANVNVVKTDGAAAAVPGTTITYSIIVSNAGPSAVSNAAVADVLPAELINATWTCTGSIGGSCDAVSGIGGIVTTADLQAGSAVTYTLTATVVPVATGTVVNTATVSVPVGVVDSDLTDNSSTDIDNLTPSVDLSIAKTDGVTSVVPGTSTTYTIMVANSGPSTAAGAQITDLLPAELINASWGCTASGGATCGTPSGSGDVSLLATLPAGGSLTIDVDADIDPTATGFVVNTATVTGPVGVTDTDPANDSATDSDVLTPTADLSITKDDGLATALPGDPVAYAIVVTNNGPSAVVGATVTDVMPAGLSAVTWTCSALPSSSCASAAGGGDIATTVDLAIGESATFVIDATIAISQIGVVTNTATVDAPVGVTDPNSADNIAIDTTMVNGLGDVSIVKSDGVATIVAGTSTTYTIVVTNPGPSQIDRIQVIDSLPAALIGASWTCAATGAASCSAASGFGSISEMIDMPAASTVTFSVTATVSPSASGTLSNTASVTLPTGIVDSDLTNNDSTDVTDIDRIADLAVTKTNHVSALTPGNSVGYDITVVNNGPSSVSGATLSDLVPASITGVTWTCTAGAGAACGAGAGSGNVSLNLDLAVGASVAVRITGTVSPNAAGTLTNSATVAPPVGVTDPDVADNTATDTDTLDPVADVSVAKSNGVTSQSPGATSSYTITVANAGPSAAAGVTIDDPLPSGVATASWTCSAAAGSSCAAASGIGAVNTTVDLAAAGTVTLTVSLQAGLFAGTLTNTVTATVAAGTTDPDPSNNVASDTDTLVFTADIAVTKAVSAAVVAVGQALNYTVVVSNAGPDRAAGVTVLDTMPAGLASLTWTCAATPGSSCPANGTGDITSSIDLAAGGSATFTVSATVTSAAPNTIVNTATAAVGPDTIDPDPTNNTASVTFAVDFTSSLSVQKTATVATALPGDAFSYTIVVSNAGPALLDDVSISDPVPAGLVALSWTCLGSAGGVCNSVIGSGSPALTADLPLGGSVTITFNVQVAPGATGSILNIVTATAGGASGQVTAQATASVEVSPVVPPTAALSITKATSVATYSTVGSVVSFTLVARNTGSATLTNVTIADPNATLTACAPVTLGPGQTLTCSAGHVVTQSDLDRGTLSNTASVSGVSPTGSTVVATSATVVVPALPITALSIVKSSSATEFVKIGDKISYTITATNTGNVTLINVVMSDPNASLISCAPTNLTPGQALTCTAVHTVTAADVAAKVILNQAFATALPVTDFEVVCPLLGASGLQCPNGPTVSAESNTVVLNRASLLPSTGGTVVTKLIVGGWLFGVGGLLLLVTGRRRRAAR